MIPEDEVTINDGFLQADAAVTSRIDGAYDEYFTPDSSTGGNFQKVQLLNPTTAFGVDVGKNLMKFSGGRNWTILSQKATACWFVSTTTGYAAYNEVIWQTTDGGQNWASVFNLQPGDVIRNFASCNGKVWGIGNNSITNRGVLIKYNP
jgi:hypothetical protein